MKESRMGSATLAATISVPQQAYNQGQVNIARGNGEPLSAITSLSTPPAPRMDMMQYKSQRDPGTSEKVFQGIKEGIDIATCRSDAMKVVCGVGLGLASVFACAIGGVLA